VALIHEAELGRQPGQVALTPAQALQRGADAEAHAVARDGCGRSPTHHNGAAQVFADGDCTRFVWTADLLPHDLAARTSELMELGIGVVKRTLEGRQA